MRDLNTLQRKASAHGANVGAYAAVVLEHPLRWTKMRQVYRLLGLVRQHGPEAVDEACRRALDAEVIDVLLIERMLARGVGEQLPLIPKPPPAPSRFVRASTDFAVRRPSSDRPPRRHPGGQADRGLPKAQSAHASPQARPAPRHPA
jgi:hypothetical protein